jgi:hypothetical protein
MTTVKELLHKLHEICGYIENGTSEKVTMH